jgi:hypothetical protein
MPETSGNVVFTDGICYAASRDNSAHVLHSKPNGFATGFNTSHVRSKEDLFYTPLILFVRDLQHKFVQREKRRILRWMAPSTNAKWTLAAFPSI